MFAIAADNVCGALKEGITLLLSKGVREESRAGPVLVAPSPVMTITRNPTQRVLFSRTRDANPFFHLIESLWMLNGQDNVAPLLRYVKNFDQFAEAGGTMHGAYGHRWRKSFGFDQLDVVVDKLRKNQNDRQCVIQMWDATDRYRMLGVDENNTNPDGSDYRIMASIDSSGGRGSNDLRGTWKDRPCNTQIMLRVRTERYVNPAVTDQNSAEWEARIAHGDDKVLDITVTCRSNDAVMGAHGANAVHFSVLQEYLAARIGVGVGRMYQLSNNYHVYLKDLDAMQARFEKVNETPAGMSVADRASAMVNSLLDDRYDRNMGVISLHMFDHPNDVDQDLRLFFDWHDRFATEDVPCVQFRNAWFDEVPVRMCLAHWLFKQGDRGNAISQAQQIGVPDWGTACVEWLERKG